MINSTSFLCQGNWWYVFKNTVTDTALQVDIINCLLAKNINKIIEAVFLNLYKASGTTDKSKVV